MVGHESLELPAGQDIQSLINKNKKMQKQKPKVNALLCETKLALIIEVCKSLKNVHMFEERKEFISRIEDCRDIEELAEVACGYVELQIA